MTLTWTENPDPLRPGARLHSAEIPGDTCYIVVQEIRVAEAASEAKPAEPAEWGWIICDEKGYPQHMRNGFTDHDGVAAVDRAKAHVEDFLQRL